LDRGGRSRPRSARARAGDPGLSPRRVHR
jgi:hypothetical protein